MNTASDRLVCYEIQPGDTLSKIAQRPFGVIAGNSPHEKLRELVRINPHLKNPSLIHPGDMIVLGSGTSPIKVDFSSADAKDFSAAWKKADYNTKRIVRKNFDVLEWLGDAKDGGEFLDKLGEQSKPVFEAVHEFSMSGVIKTEVLKLSKRLEQMLVVRKGTIALIQRLRISVVREPIVIITYTKNGLYPITRALTKVINVAEQIKLGKKLTYFEIGLEGLKTIKTAIDTKSVKETAKQAGRGGIKVALGTAGAKVGQQVCKLTVRKGPRGWLVCGVALGVGVVGGSKLGDSLAKTLLGAPVETELPGLP